MKKIIIVLIFLLALVTIAACSNKANRIGPLGSTHIHADIKVYVDGKYVDFSKPQYQLRAKFVHFEDGDGDVLHIHATNVNINHMLETLKIRLDNSCLILNDGSKYCNSNDKTVKLYVNNLLNYEYGDYAMKDLDRILIRYGNEDQQGIQKQLNSVTKKASQFSN